MRNSSRQPPTVIGRPKRVLSRSSVSTSLGAISDDPALLQEDDPIDLRDDLFAVMRDQDEGRAVPDDAADLFHEGVPGPEVQPRCRLVEDEGTGRGRQHSGEHDAARLPTRHLIERAPREVGCADGIKRLGGTASHVVGHDTVAQDAMRDEERREHCRFARNAALAVARDEALMEVGRHDPSCARVPIRSSGRRTRGRPPSRRLHERPFVVRQQTSTDCQPFGPRDGRVLAFADRQPESVKTRRSP